MTFYELPEKVRLFFIKNIKRKVIFIKDFDENIEHGRNIINAINLATIIADDVKLILPKEIIEELFPYMFGQE